MKSADVAQLVEQLIRNEQVTGSIPAIGSKLRLEHGASQGANGSISSTLARVFFVGDLWNKVIFFTNKKTAPRGYLFIYAENDESSLW